MNIEPTETSAIIAATFVCAVEHYAELSSTQDRARAAAAEPDVRMPLLVVADRQTSGRGRGTNRWWTGEGSLAFSLLFDPADLALPERDTPLTALAAGVAIVDALQYRLPDQRVGLHWPNDVYCGSRKLSGILAERLADGRQVIGVGVNTNNSVASAPAELQQKVGTLYDLSGKTHAHGELLVDILRSLEAVFRDMQSSPLRLGVRLNELCLQHGQMLTVSRGQEKIHGRCEGIASDGGLMLETAAGPVVVYSGTLG